MSEANIEQVRTQLQSASERAADLDRSGAFIVDKAAKISEAVHAEGPDSIGGLLERLNEALRDQIYEPAAELGSHGYKAAKQGAAIKGQLAETLPAEDPLIAQADQITDAYDQLPEASRDVWNHTYLIMGAIALLRTGTRALRPLTQRVDEMSQAVQEQVVGLHTGIEEREQSL